MKRWTYLAVSGLLWFPCFAEALTVDEIIKLKRAGVADSTIELLIKKDAERASGAGVFSRDGWMVHTTGTRETRHGAEQRYGNVYPIAVYPWVGGVRRR